MKNEFICGSFGALKIEAWIWILDGIENKNKNKTDCEL